MVKRLRSKGFKCVQTADIRTGLKQDGDAWCSTETVSANKHMQVVTT